MIPQTINLGNPVSAHPLNRGMLHWYAGLPNVSHGSILYDVAGFADGTFTNGPLWDYDPSGFACLSLDGTNDYVTMGDVGDVEGVTELTVQALINTNTLAGGTDGLRYIVSKEDGGGFVFILRQLTGGDKCQWFCFDGSVRGAQEVQGLTANTWNLLTATYKAGVGLALYRNGLASQPIGFSSVGTLSTNAAPLAIGSLPSTSGRAFSGFISNVRILNRYTTPDEAWDLYQQSLAGNPLLFQQVSRTSIFLPTVAAPPQVDGVNIDIDFNDGTFTGPINFDVSDGSTATVAVGGFLSSTPVTEDMDGANEDIDTQIALLEPPILFPAFNQDIDSSVGAFVVPLLGANVDIDFNSFITSIAGTPGELAAGRYRR